MFKRASFGLSECASPSLVVTAFQGSLDNLLLEATKNRTMTHLRDAVHSVRVKGFLPEDVFHTFVLACDTLHSRREYRALLLQSLSDLGKIATLRLLPISSTVVHIVCDLIRKLLRSNISGPPKQCSLSASLLRGSVGDADDPCVPSQLEGSAVIDQTELDLGASSIQSGDPAEHQPAEDEELQMRILQTLMAFLSACVVDNGALSDIIGLIFTIYILAVPESRVEATCAATIEQQTLELLRSFCDSSAVDDGASLSSQFQSAAYMKDVCVMCSGHAPKWLRLGYQQQQQPQQQQQQQQQHFYVNTIFIPKRLRLLLLRTLVAHFTDIEPISSPQQINIFFSQWLNEDVVSLALSRGIAHRKDNHLGLSDFLRRDEPSSDEEEEQFHLTQKLAVTAVSKALPAMRHTAPSVLRHHAMLVKLSAEGDGGEEDARRMAILLALWRRAIADHEVLRQLLLLPQQQQNNSPTSMNEVSDMGALSEEEKEDKDNENENENDAVRIGGGCNAFVGLVAAAARLLTAVIAAADGAVDMDAQRMGRSERHPATGQAGGVLAFLTMCTQSLARVAVEFATAPATAVKSQSPFGEVRAAFVALHPSLLRCYTLAAQYLFGDDVVHIILKGTTHLVQTACALDLHAQRDGYLQIFLSQLFLRQSHNPPQQSSQQQQQQQQRERDEGNSNSIERGGSAVRSRRMGETHEERTPSMYGMLGVNHIHPLQLQQQQEREQEQYEQEQLRRRVDLLQQKLYVLKSVISVASSMGHVLGDGWGPVASCLFAAEPLLLRYRCAVEDCAKNRRRPTSSTQQQLQQDAVRSAEQVRNALHLLFINSATAPDETGLHDLLAHYVAKATSHALTATVESIAAFRAAGECCALALVAAASVSVSVSVSSPLTSSSVDRLRRLWGVARPFFAHAFDAPTLQRLFLPAGAGRGAAEGIAPALARLLEDVAIVMAQFCRPGLSAGGPYVSAPLLVRFAALSPSASGEAGPIDKDAALSECGDGTYPWRQLLAAPAELLATAYDQMRQAAALEASLAVLREVLRLVQGVGEELRGGAWVYLLGILRRAAVLEEEENNEGEGKEDVPAVVVVSGGGGADAAAAAAAPAAELIADGGVTTYFSPGQADNASGSGNNNHHHNGDNGSGGGGGVVTNAPEVPMPSHPPQALVDGATGAAAATTSMATANYAKQSVSIAFRALETIQHSCITSLDDEGLRQLIRCGGAFMTHSIKGGEARLNINLSSVQLLWSVADFIVSREEARRAAGAIETATDTGDDLLWCTLLLQLYDGCLDVRPEVRQSALKTLFSLVQTYGARLSAESWICVLRNIIVPLVDVALEAAVACATRSDVDKLPRRTHSFCFSGPSSPAGSSRDDSVPAFLDVTARHAAALQAHFLAFPAFFDEMRVTLMDSACRVFVTHHRAMRHALQQRDQQTPPNLSFSELKNMAELLHVALGAFLGLCATSRLVARGTSGEATALSAVRALRALAVEATGLLSPEEMESAWQAVEQLLCRGDGDGDDGKAATELCSSARTQCTTAVVAAIVTTLSEFAAVTRWGSVSTSPVPSSPVAVQARDAPDAAGASFLQQLRHAFSVPVVPDVLWPSHKQQHQQKQKQQEQEQYMARFLRLTQEALCAPATTDSYFFPDRVQLAVVEAWRNLWPVLAAHERDAVLELALHQFPAPDAIHFFLSQGAADDSTAARTPPHSQRRVSLQEALPPGAHPAFLVVLMDFLRAATAEADETARRAAPGAVRAAGALLLLECAEPHLLSLRGPAAASFQPPVGFFNAADACLRHFLAGVLWGLREADHTEGSTEGNTERSTEGSTERRTEGSTERRTEGSTERRTGGSTERSSGGNTERRTGGSITAVRGAMGDAQCTHRRAGLVAFTEAFAALVENSSKALRSLSTQPPPPPPDHVVRAVGRLEGFVRLLRDLIPHVLRISGDVGGAADLLAVLVPASSANAPLFAGVARLGLEVLRQWSVAGPAVTEPEGKDEKELENREEKKKREPFRRQLQCVARTSICARNRAVLQRFMADSSSREARQMAKTTLQSMILLFPAKIYEADGSGEGQQEEEEEEAENVENVELEAMQSIMVDLVRVVEHTGDDAEFRSMLSRAMMTVCVALGFAGTG